jgi:hypothetical protein
VERPLVRCGFMPAHAALSRSQIRGSQADSECVLRARLVAAVRRGKPMKAAEYKDVPMYSKCNHFPGTCEKKPIAPVRTYCGCPGQGIRALNRRYAGYFRVSRIPLPLG